MTHLYVSKKKKKKKKGRHSGGWGEKLDKVLYP
jgi:hypothetical protein